MEIWGGNRGFTFCCTTVTKHLPWSGKEDEVPLLISNAIQNNNKKRMEKQT